MKKKIMKIGNSHGIYFTNNEMELYGMVIGDVIEIDDMLIEYKLKHRKLPKSKDMIKEIKKEVKK